MAALVGGCLGSAFDVRCGLRRSMRTGHLVMRRDARLLPARADGSPPLRTPVVQLPRSIRLTVHVSGLLRNG